LEDAGVILERTRVGHEATVSFDVSHGPCVLEAHAAAVEDDDERCWRARRDHETIDAAGARLGADEDERHGEADHVAATWHAWTPFSVRASSIASEIGS